MLIMLVHSTCQKCIHVRASLRVVHESTTFKGMHERFHCLASQAFSFSSFKVASVGLCRGSQAKKNCRNQHFELWRWKFYPEDVPFSFCWSWSPFEKVIAVQSSSVSVSLYVTLSGEPPKRWGSAIFRSVTPFVLSCYVLLWVFAWSWPNYSNFYLLEQKLRLIALGNLPFSYWFTYKITSWENRSQLVMMTGDPHFLGLLLGL